MGQARTIKELLDLGERVLSDSSHLFEDHDFRAEAEELLAFSLAVVPDELRDDDEPAPRTRERYLSLVARRAGGEPGPVLTGRIEFYGLDLKVWPGAFVPRPSSELTVNRAVRKLRGRRDPTVVDVATGAGPIALAIANALPAADVWGTDISKEGLGQARRNARRLRVANVSFRQGDMYGALPKKLAGTVDLITGHVPYVSPGELEDLPSEVKEHEPLSTLSDLSDDGLGLVRHAISGAPHWLKPGGWLLLEISEDLGRKLERMCVKAGFEDIGIASDEDGLSIVVEARKTRRSAHPAR
jgi:release factor glutamine methyltransferase